MKYSSQTTNLSLKIITILISCSFIASISCSGDESSPIDEKKTEKKGREESTGETKEKTSTIRINEVTSSGDDVVELYNTSDKPINISGWYYLDSKKDIATKNVFPEGSVIQGHGFITRSKADNEDKPGLGKEDGVFLYNKNDELVDSTTWSEGQAVVSWCRLPDGTGDFQTCQATLGSANLAEDKSTEKFTLLINEISNQTKQIEFYNSGEKPLNVSGLYIQYKEGDKEIQKLPIDTNPKKDVDALSFYVFTLPDQETHDLSAALEIKLYDKNDKKLDEVSVGAGAADESYCRIPNGETTWTSCEVTMGRTNKNAAEAPASPKVLINEVTSSGDDVVELYNASDKAVDISGWYYLDDQKDMATKNVFPEGSVIEARGFITRSKVDNEDKPGLGKADGVFLYNKADELVDSTTWEEGQAAVSWCRIPDGIGEFAECSSQTFGATNGQ